VKKAERIGEFKREPRRNGWKNEFKSFIDSI
jgi:hypothetical protein